LLFIRHAMIRKKLNAFECNDSQGNSN
jgi:hypothetical protein